MKKQNENFTVVTGNDIFTFTFFDDTFSLKVVIKNKAVYIFKNFYQSDWHKLKANLRDNIDIVNILNKSILNFKFNCDTLRIFVTENENLFKTKGLRLIFLENL